MSGVASKVLFLLNEHSATEALLGDAFAENGFDIDTFVVVPAEKAHDPAGDVTFPDPLGYDVIVPLGATWAVYNPALLETWVSTEMQMMRDAADAGIALLGVCFGGQLLAQAFGGTVERAPRQEVGWYDVTSDRPDVVPAGPWFQWHFDRWTLPPGATEIARTANASQAFTLGRTLALQFHPEVDADLLKVWLADDHDDIEGVGLTHEEILTRTDELADDVAVRVRALVRGFLTRVAGHSRPS
ncbi:glutamine amidotransferase [Mycolicibacterium parafortuitum]|uniref:Glutamine amidotransferase n=1 Tax=Mycolicibacterium parafortuitum TaxID=39692 RepID=A0A7I7U5Q7_MYCPF|nr:gamma-glutamyl-gamma-aminobutyrate hydrolase family protein [Mycolicibacterium parafortuitum]BBY76702.1 glutamine amidotransferase [Mycolicibacterium parafortuitum]